MLCAACAPSYADQFKPQPPAEPDHADPGDACNCPSCLSDCAYIAPCMREGEEKQ